MKCRHLYLDPSRLQEFCEKNHIGEQIDSFEGALLDGFIAAFPGGYAAFYPHYLNEWSSDYYVEYGYGNAATSGITGTNLWNSTMLKTNPIRQPST